MQIDVMVRAPKLWLAALRSRLKVLLGDSTSDDAMPGWLASLVVHMLLIILLGLWLRADMAQQRGVELDVTLRDTSEGTAPEAFNTGPLDSMMEFETSAQEEKPDESESTPRLADDLLEQIELEELAFAPSPSDMFGSGTTSGAASDDGAGGGRGGGAGMVRTSLFGVESEGRKFVYVCDCSGSMSYVVANPESLNEYIRVPFMAARAELMSSINDLGDENEFGLIFYNHRQFPFDPTEIYTADSSGKRRRASRWDERLFAATPENKTLATHFITQFRAHGETDHVTALELALRMKPDVIFLMTDAEAKDDPTPKQVMSLTRRNRRRATINIVQFAPLPRPTSTMIVLAERNGGKHVFFDISQVSAPVNEPAATVITQ